MPLPPVTAEFSGGRAGTAPLTWGQAGIWGKLQRDPGCGLDFSRVLEVEAGGVTVTAAAAALSRVVERHEALRARLRPSGGTVVQVVAGAGKIPVGVTESPESSLRAGVAAAVARFLRTAFDYFEEFPVRVQLVTAGGQVRFAVLNFAHIAVDGGGAEIVLADLRAALGGRPFPAGPARQPLDLARDQREAAGRKQTERAARYWSTQYRRIPPIMFPAAWPPGHPQRQQAVLRSPALCAATATVAATAGASTSTVLLAAVATLAGAWTGNTVSAMNMPVHNRAWPRHRNAVTNLVQLGLFVLDLEEDMSFTGVVQRASAAALRAYRFAYYDEDVIGQVRAQVSAERGTEVNPFCCFNDIRGLSVAGDEGGTAGQLGAGDFSEAARGDSARGDSASRSTLTWVADPAASRCPFCLTVQPAGRGFALSLTADTRHLPHAAIERFLRGTENLLIQAASGGLSMAGVLAQIPAGRSLPGR